MDDNMRKVCVWYAIRRTKSYADFCEAREAPLPSFDEARRFVGTHWNEVPQWVRDVVELLDRQRAQ